MRPRDDGIRVARVTHAISEAVGAYILPGAGDPVVSDLALASVDVAGDLASVTIHRVPGPRAVPPPEPEVRAALRGAESYFRREIAEAVSLKRTPVVHLRYIPMAR